MENNKIIDQDSAALEASNRKPHHKQIVSKHKSFQNGMAKFLAQQHSRGLQHTR